MPNAKSFAVKKNIDKFIYAYTIINFTKKIKMFF